MKSFAAAAVVCSTWVVILFAIGLARAESEVEHYLGAHKENLEVALSQGDIISVQAIFSGLRKFGVQSSFLNTQIFANGKHRIISSGGLTKSLFSKSISFQVRNNGLTLGTVQYRISFIEILRTVLRYDLNILAMILISNLLIFIGFNILIQSDVHILNRALVTSITDYDKVDQLIKERTLLSRLVLSDDFGKTIKNLILEVAQLRKTEIDRSALDVQKALARQVAHDIRSPLSAINMIMGKVSGSPEVMDLLRHSVDRISAMASDLLVRGKSSNFPALTEESLRPEMSDTDLGTIFNHIGRLVKEVKIRFPNVDIEFVHASGQNEKLLIDPNMLVRILSILIENSLESLRGDHSFIRVSASQENSSLIVSVDDSGVGIEQCTLLRLGREMVSRGKSNGNGLGLFYAHQATNAMSGSFKISSQLGVGTSVTIRFGLATNHKVVTGFISADT